jgi:beta-glucosidase-like glycosyl hydrolase
VNGVPSPARFVIEALRLDRWSSAQVQDRVQRALALGVGGFVIFGGEADAVKSLTDRMRREAGRPLLIGADLERGAGQQIRGLSELPPPAALAVHPDAEAAAEIAGELTGREALSVGINWVLAPVLDLDLESTNPIVATRSFGSNPEIVGRLGSRWISACEGVGAITCAKHFPGHGRTHEDSHVGLPTVDADAEDLEADLAPFAATLPGASTAMVAHVAFPALGSNRPATLARSVVTDILRGRFGFDGPVATDAMIMGAIGANDASAAVEALQAGCDLIVYPSDVKATVDALERGLREESTACLALAAHRRIERLFECSELGYAVDSVARNEIEASVMSSGVDTMELAIATLVDGTGGLSGWRSSVPTSVIGVSDDLKVTPPATHDALLSTIVVKELQRAGWTITPHANDAEQRIVVLAATPMGWKGHSGPSASVVHEAKVYLEGAKRSLVVLLGHARWLDVIGVPSICAWSTETIMERAAGRWIVSAAGL